MLDNVGTRLVLGLFPSVIVLVTYILSKDLLVQQISLLLFYLIVSLAFDKLVKPLNWESQFGKELSNWVQNTMIILFWLAVGLGLGFLFWFLAYQPSILITIDVEIIPFPYVTEYTLQWLYWVVVMVAHSIVEPVAEELYFRCLIGDGKVDNTLFNNYVSAISYGILYFFKYYFVYRDTTKVAVWIGIFSFLMGLFLNVLIRQGLSYASAFNIGVSLNYPFRLGWQWNVWTRLSNPRLFLLFDPKNCWI